jgi:thioredoxin reductase
MSTNPGESLDVVVGGGGPAGLSAALVLGRQRRRALVCDTDAPANAVSPATHGALGVDGVSPRELRGTGRVQCERYPSVSFQETEVLAVEPVEGGFRVALADERQLLARKVILACGRRYELSPIPGARELFGSRVLHCAFCHGWESRDKALAIIGGDAHAFQLAVMLRGLGAQLMLCTNGTPELEDDQLDQLQGAGVAVRREPVAEIAETGEEVELRFARGGSQLRDAVFLRPTCAITRSSHASSSTGATMGESRWTTPAKPRSRALCRRRPVRLRPGITRHRDRGGRGPPVGCWRTRTWPARQVAEH